MCTSQLNRPSERDFIGVSSLPQERRFQQPKSKSESDDEAHAVLSYLRMDVSIPSGQIETRLRKLKGIKEAAVNHVSHTVKIHYDPSIVTREKIRTLLKKPVSGR